MGPRRRGRKQALHHEPRGVISLRSNRYGLLIAGLTHVVPWVMATAAVVFFIVWGVSFTDTVRDTAAPPSRVTQIKPSSVPAQSRLTSLGDGPSE